MAERKTKTVKVDRPTGNDDPNLFVGINGVNYILPKGKTSDVPEFVAAEIERSEAAKEKFYATSDDLLEKAK